MEHLLKNKPSSTKFEPKLVGGYVKKVQSWDGHKVYQLPWNRGCRVPPPPAPAQNRWTVDSGQKIGHWPVDKKLDTGQWTKNWTADSGQKIVDKN